MVPGVLAGIIFLGSLALVFSEKVNRSIVAFTGGALMVIVGKLLHFYSEEAALAAIDFNTLGLLLGMMMLVAMLEPTGFFQYLAVLAARSSKGEQFRLFILLGIITTLLSMFLDNVTTVVLIAPVTILICEILGVSAVPYLVSEALLSNTGGVATLIGDPPNVLIGSAAGLSFVDFLKYSLPIVLFCWLGAILLLRQLFKKDLSRRPRSVKAVMRLNPAETLNQPEAARRILIVLGAALVMFFIHHILHVSPALVALGAAAAALIWVRPDINEVLKKVEWSVLLFFAALFVMVGGLEESGVLAAGINLLDGAANMSPILFGMLLIWTVAGLSAVVDNIPITVALIPIVRGLGESGMDVSPLWWALAFGAGFGGNGTIIGSTANIIVASFSERTRQPITSALWLRRGFPVMLVTCAIASVLFMIFYPWL